MNDRAPLRTVADLLAALPPALRAEPHDCDGDTPLGRPRTDSRAVQPGDCFAAVPGLTVDGHAFVSKAIAAGAGLLLVRRDRELALSHPRVVVDDSDLATAILAAGWYGWPGDRLALAGVTGTNGKTSTAHLVSACFRAANLVHLRLGTTGNWLADHEDRAGFTTPFPVELQQLLADALARGASHGVMEVSSHALEQGRARPLKFAAVGLTSFSQDHLDYHPSMAAYLEAKCLLARSYARADAVAIAPREHPEACEQFMRAAADAGITRRWRSSRIPMPESEAELCVLTRDHAAAGLHARIRTPHGPLELRSPMVGDFNLDNLMVAIGLSLGMGLQLRDIEAGLARSSGAPGRLELVKLPDVEHSLAGPAVYVDYAHTPDAVARALEALRPSAEQRGGRLVVLLGCGGDRDTSKRALMGEVASRGADRFYATSDNPRTEPPEQIVDQMLTGVVPGGATVIREVDRAAAIAQAVADADPRDIVLLAGKGHEDYQVLGTEKIHFDDREHAAAALARRRID